MKIKISPALFVLLLVFVWQSPFHTVAQTPRGKPEVKVDLTIFDSYVGQYLDPELTDFTYSFFREGDKLYVQFPDQPKYEIVPLSETRFSVKDSDAQLEFVKDSGGRAVLMIWRQHGGERSAKKLSDQPAKDTRVPYKRMEVMIPARDGVKLFTVILMPENETEKLPIILSRTPYGITEWTSDRLNSVRSELAKEKYIFAFQDIRGKNRSEGEFVMMRPPRDKSDSKSIDESTDAFDTIDWLIKNLPENNGRVGIVGVSYPGWLASVALLDPHPSLKAVSPQAPMIDVWVGDDFFHNGAFRLSYSYEFVKSMESSSTGMEVDKDAYDRRLRSTLFPEII